MYINKKQRFLILKSLLFCIGNLLVMELVRMEIKTVLMVHEQKCGNFAPSVKMV